MPANTHSETKSQQSASATQTIRKGSLWLALIGISLLLLGGWLTYLAGRRYSEHHYITDAGSCRMDMIEVELANHVEGPAAVVLFHGLSANKTIMMYLARAMAETGARVFVPDLPGHGSTGGPFSTTQAETCAGSLVRGLAARGLIEPDKTILAGHSMGAAIALRLAVKFRPAGVIALSPAPMKVAHGVTKEVLLYPEPPPIGPNTLIMAGQYEPKGLSGNAADLAATAIDSSVVYRPLAGNSHVSVLFSPTVARYTQEWVSNVLHLPQASRLPWRGNLLGGLFGLTGILLLAGPFLDECMGKEPANEQRTDRQISKRQVTVEFVLAAIAAVFVLRFWMPLRVVHIFEGDYLASFFLIVGVLVIALHARAASRQFRVDKWALAGAVVAATILHLLITGWLQLTITGAWMTVARWSRFPLFFMAAFLFLYALEVVLGPVRPEAAWTRYGFAALVIVFTWSALAVGVIFAHSGQILLVLLSPYIGLFFLAMGLGAQLVRRISGSPAASAVFGAILLTGFALVLFPVS